MLLTRRRLEYIEIEFPRFIKYYEELNSDQQIVFMKSFFNEMKNHLHHMPNLKDFVSEFVMCTCQTLELLSLDDSKLVDRCRTVFDNIDNMLNRIMFKGFLQNIIYKHCVILHCFVCCVRKSMAVIESCGTVFDNIRDSGNTTDTDCLLLLQERLLNVSSVSDIPDV